jgi:hypothetical protein
MWRRLSSSQQQTIIDDIAVVMQEVIRELRTDHAKASKPQSTDLHTAIESSPGFEQSREFATPVRLAAESADIGVEAERH